MTKGIRKETLERIALAAIEKRNISRDTLAKELGISSMTVGKAVHVFKEAGLLKETRDPVSRGRHAALLSPSELWVYLCVFMSADMMTLMAESASGDEVATVRRAQDPSLSCRDNVTSIVRELCGAHELENRIAARAVIVLSKKDEFNGFDLREDELYDATAIVHSEIAGRFTDENVLYLGISDGTLRPLIVSHGNIFYRNAAKDIHTSSDADMASRIAHLISSISIYSRIDRVILEGSKNEENGLLFLIKDTLLNDFRISERDLPCLVYHGEYSFMRKAVFERARQDHIEKISNSFFVEQ